MALPAEETHAELTTERVPGGRRRPVAVATLAVLILGTLLWKPWEARPGAPGTFAPARSFPAVAAASGAPSIDPPTPNPTPKPVFTPSPDSGAPPADAAGGLGSIDLATSPGEACVYCVYGAKVGQQHRLTIMFVAPPLVLVSDAARGRVREITFRPEVEANQLQGIFSADWSFLAAGRRQRANLNGGANPSFRQVQVRVNVGQLPATAVLRVAVVVKWLGRNGNLLATERLHPSSYDPLDATAGAIVPDGCPARY